MYFFLSVFSKWHIKALRGLCGQLRGLSVSRLLSEHAGGIKSRVSGDLCHPLAEHAEINRRFEQLQGEMLLPE